MDLKLVLVAPEIPQNTGAIGRLCVCLDAELHLVKPLGFSLDESAVKRAGLDYWHHVDLYVHDDWDSFLQTAEPTRLFFASTKGSRSYFEVAFEPGDTLVFGCETAGLPAFYHEQYAEDFITIPMPGKHSRSLNLANATAIIAYEALRQLSPT